MARHTQHRRHRRRHTPRRRRRPPPSAPAHPPHATPIRPPPLQLARPFATKDPVDGQMPMDYKYDSTIQPNDARVEPSTSWGEILDRSSQMLFMTEIFRGFWWVATAAPRPP